MKRPVLIIAFGVVVISLLLMVNEKWIKESSAPKTADKPQTQETLVTQSSPTVPKKKMETKPTTKPPVYDLSKKAHWYDPETTVGLYEAKTLAEWLEPFKPTAEEFQIIAQYESEYKKLRESLSEDEYYSVEGRKWIIDEILKLNKKLREQLGDERTQFYAEVRELATGYYYTWKVLTVNGISEERVAEFRELADEFNQQMHGRPLYRAERRIPRYSPAGWSIGGREGNQIAKSFREQIEKEFGKQVLDDIQTLIARTLFMDSLDRGNMKMGILLGNPKQQERLINLYDVGFIESADNLKELKELERLEQLEMKLQRAWSEQYGPNSWPDLPLIGWIP